MGRPSSAYAPKAPAGTVLHRIVRDHFETFRAEAARVYEREALPRFIQEEFQGFLTCGFLAGGFARFHCAGCGLDRLVPFSCKGRAVCPSCGGRRMAERAAHLVDQVFVPRGAVPRGRPSQNGPSVHFRCGCFLSSPIRIEIDGEACDWRFERPRPMSQPEDDFVSADVDDGKDDVGRDQDAVIRKCVNRRIADFSVNLSRNDRSDL